MFPPIRTREDLKTQLLTGLQEIQDPTLKGYHDVIANLSSDDLTTMLKTAVNTIPPDTIAAQMRAIMGPEMPLPIEELYSMVNNIQ